MALTPCTVVAITPSGKWRFVAAVPRNFVSGIGAGHVGTAQVGCVYWQPIRITWNCCPTLTPGGITTNTFGRRWEIRDAGPGSTLPVLNAAIPIPGNVASAWGANVSIAHWWANPKAAKALCKKGNLPVISTVDVYDTLQADCNPSRKWWLYKPKPYILYPWGGKQEITITPGGGIKLGPIKSIKLDIGVFLSEKILAGELIFTSENPVIKQVSNFEQSDEVSNSDNCGICGGSKEEVDNGR